MQRTWLIAILMAFKMYADEFSFSDSVIFDEMHSLQGQKYISEFDSQSNSIEILSFVFK